MHAVFQGKFLVLQMLVLVALKLGLCPRVTQWCSGAEFCKRKDWPFETMTVNERGKISAEEWTRRLLFHSSKTTKIVPKSGVSIVSRFNYQFLTRSGQIAPITYKSIDAVLPSIIFLFCRAKLEARRGHSVETKRPCFGWGNGCEVFVRNCLAKPFAQLLPQTL